MGNGEWRRGLDQNFPIPHSPFPTLEYPGVHNSFSAFRMSYRSFKRVLGETSLERKCRFLFGACLLILITLSFFWYGTKTEDLVTKQNQTKGRLLVRTILTLAHCQKLESNSEFKPVVEELSKVQLDQYQSSFIRPGSGYDSAGVPIDRFERELIAKFEEASRPKSVDEAVWEPRTEDNGREYQYYEAIYASKSCIGCHRT